MCCYGHAGVKPAQDTWQAKLDLIADTQLIAIKKALFPLIYQYAAPLSTLGGSSHLHILEIAVSSRHASEVRNITMAEKG